MPSAMPPRAPRADAPRVLVTREEPGPVSEAVRLVHGEPIELPLLVTRWLAFELPGGQQLEAYDWIAFTSARAFEAIATKAHASGWNWPPHMPCDTIYRAIAGLRQHVGTQSQALTGRSERHH